MKIILDYDDVLVPCNQMAVNRVNAETGSDFCLDDIEGWGPSGTALDRRLDYFKDPGFMGTIPVPRSSISFMEELAAKNVELFIATSVEPQCAGVRIANILENFPMVDPGNILIGSRKDILMGDVMLDDGWHNLVKSGVRYPVLFRRPWNRHISGVPAVGNHREFLGLIDFLLGNKTPPTDDPKVLSLVGPSASGKTTLSQALIESGRFSLVRSCTTRKPRTENEPYHFMERADFLDKLEKGYFLEHTSYMGEFYGTSIQDVREVLDSGRHAVIPMDVNGAIAMRTAFPSQSITFFLERSKELCIRDILQRALPLEETVDRIVSLDREAKNASFCDHVLKVDGKVPSDLAAEVLEIVR